MEQPLFIFGCYRSGTTLLRLILNAHPEIHIPNETHYITKLGPKIREYGDLNNSESLFRLVDDINYSLSAEQWNKRPSVEYLMESCSELTFQEIIRSIALLECSDEKRESLKYWGDKTPIYVLSALYLFELFPEAKFINVVRDVRDVCASSIKNRIGGGNCFAVAQDWRERILSGMASEQVIGEERFLTIRYEDLVEKPDAILGKIFSFLEINFTPDVLKYHSTESAQALINQSHHLNVVQPLNAKSVGAYKTELNSKEINVIESTCYNTLKSFGYKIDNPFGVLKNEEKVYYTIQGVVKNLMNILLYKRRLFFITKSRLRKIKKLP